MLGLVDRADRHGWRLVIGDLALDTATPVGRMTLTILSAIAEFERARIVERITEALESRRLAGVLLGRPVELAADVRRRITALRLSGLSLPAVARLLTEEGVPTARGGRWYPSTVAAVLRSIDLDPSAA